MTQRELDRAVSARTGENLNRVRRIGFSEIVAPTRLPLRLSALYQRARVARRGRGVGAAAG